MTRYRICQLFGDMEGFGVRGAIPTVRNNRIDLRHGPKASHEGIGLNDIGIYATVEDGDSDADRQFELWAQRGLTLTEAVDKQLGITRDVDGRILVNADRNDPVYYLAYVANGLFHSWKGIYGDWYGINTPISTILNCPAELTQANLS